MVALAARCEASHDAENAPAFGTSLDDVEEGEREGGGSVSPASHRLSVRTGSHDGGKLSLREAEAANDGPQS